MIKMRYEDWMYEEDVTNELSEAFEQVGELVEWYDLVNAMENGEFRNIVSAIHNSSVG